MIFEKRRLTIGEINQLRGKVFGSEVDYSLIRLVRNSPLTWFRCFVVIDNHIHVPECAWREDFSLPVVPPVLFHEVTHVWQFQNRHLKELKNYWWGMAGLEHILHKNPYLYKISDGSRLTNYRFEQQGKIVQDYISSPSSNLASVISQDLPIKPLN